MEKLLSLTRETRVAFEGIEASWSQWSTIALSLVAVLVVTRWYLRRQVGERINTRSSDTVLPQMHD